MQINTAFFATRQKQYMYDGNTGDIVSIDMVEKELLTEACEKSMEEAAAALEGQYEADDIKKASQRLGELRKAGLLQPYPNNICIDNIIDEAEYDLENNMQMICLCVTQSCNLRCEYCAYSGIYDNNRIHGEKTMSFGVARGAIDYGISKAAARGELAVSFYGGEPLMGFELIKECIEYIKREYPGKRILYSIATNGTLLRKEYADFLAENNVIMHISLDGPQEYHDEYRKFAASGMGSFRAVRENILYLRDKHPGYYSSHVGFGITLSPYRSLEKLEDFLLQSDFIGPKNHVRISKVNSGERLAMYDKKKTSEAVRQSIIESSFTDVRYMHARIHGSSEYLSRARVPSAFNDSIERFHRDRIKRSASQEILPGGCCIPGANKLYVTADGEYFICEKCNETADTLKLGSVRAGIELSRVKRIIEDFYLSTREECIKCWANIYCSICPIQIETEGGLSREKKLERCGRVRAKLKSDLTKYMTILEKNPFAFE